MDILSMDLLKDRPNILFLILVKCPKRSLMLIPKLRRPIYREKLIKALTVYKEDVTRKGKVVLQRWLINGKLHREDGPALIDNEGVKWYYNGKLHRDDGPAQILTDGTQFWYRYGRKHRNGGPATIYASGGQRWLLNGKYHREDGPAIIYADGSHEWYLHDEKIK